MYENTKWKLYFLIMDYLSVTEDIFTLVDQINSKITDREWWKIVWKTGKNSKILALQFIKVFRVYFEFFILPLVYLKLDLILSSVFHCYICIYIFGICEMKWLLLSLYFLSDISNRKPKLLLNIKNKFNFANCCFQKIGCIYSGRLTSWPFVSYRFQNMTLILLVSLLITLTALISSHISGIAYWDGDVCKLNYCSCASCTFIKIASHWRPGTVVMQ